MSEVEKIDQASEKSDSYTELVDSIVSFLNATETNVADRLLLERKVRKYQESSTTDWLLNLIVTVHKRCQTKEKS
jgi:hypothetical protein